MTVEYTIQCGQITEAKLVDFEQELGTKLPEDYRNFLLKYNSAIPHPSSFFISSEQGSSMIQYFLGICDEQWHSLRYFIKAYASDVPTNIMPIAPDGGGNLTCLSIKGDDYGKVYFWDRDFADFDGNPTYENLHLLADDFGTFLKHLYELQ